MEFRYTEKVGYILGILCLFTPFIVSYQVLVNDEIFGFVLGPFWQISLHEQFPDNFAMSPLPLFLYLPFWGIGLYMAKIAMDTGRLQNLSRKEYAMKIAKVWLFHILLLYFFGSVLINAYPPPTTIPLPIMGALSLILTNLIVRKQDEVWEDTVAMQ